MRITHWRGSNRSENARFCSPRMSTGCIRSAGSKKVIDLHGRLDLVRCMGCERRIQRDEFQHEMGRLNPGWLDARCGRRARWRCRSGGRRFRVLRGAGLRDLRRHPQAGCRVLRRERAARFVDAALGHLQKADAMLIAGSSLMVYSGFRFVQAAVRAGFPLPRSISAARAPTSFSASRSKIAARTRSHFCFSGRMRPNGEGPGSRCQIPQSRTAAQNHGAARGCQRRISVR